ncbi:MAG: 50S ribosomal protein L21 [Gammaproteobacteria bacterium]|nr:50S ribosomal protein L21 [Gammaproteobacteria bacterium]
MFAVFESGGKQHRVVEGEVVRLERLEGEPGDNIVFDRVLMIAEGDDIAIGEPLVEGGRVTGEVVNQGRGKKISVIKFKRRKNYLRKKGHRQAFTDVRITAINR